MIKILVQKRSDILDIVVEPAQAEAQLTPTHLLLQPLQAGNTPVCSRVKAVGFAVGQRCVAGDAVLLVQSFSVGDVGGTDDATGARNRATGARSER